MESKIYLIATKSIFAFALIAAAGIPTAFVSVLAQGEGGDIEGMTGGEGGMSGGEGQETGEGIAEGQP
jgi:hypothetical protein